MPDLTLRDLKVQVGLIDSSGVEHLAPDHPNGDRSAMRVSMNWGKHGTKQELPVCRLCGNFSRKGLCPGCAGTESFGATYVCARCDGYVKMGPSHKTPWIHEGQCPQCGHYDAIQGRSGGSPGLTGKARTMAREATDRMLAARIPTIDLPVRIKIARSLVSRMTFHDPVEQRVFATELMEYLQIFADWPPLKTRIQDEWEMTSGY